jgi:hypothetical protein
MAATQIAPAVSHPRSAAWGNQGLAAGRATPGTTSFKLFNDACMSITGTRLPSTLL